MELRYVDPNLKRLATEAAFTAGFPRGVVEEFRRSIQAVRAARDAEDLLALQSLGFEYLDGRRSGKVALRLQNGYRLVGEMEDLTVNLRAIEIKHETKGDL